MFSKVLCKMELDAARRRPPAVLRIALVLALLPAVAQAAGHAMFPSLGVSDKPQSKIWHQAGSWWAAMNGTDRIGIYELLPDSTWAARDSVCPAVPPLLMGGTNDVLWDGSSLYIAAFDSTVSHLYKYSWVDSTRDWVRAWSTPVAIPTGPGSETVALSKDGAGRLWSVCETNMNIELRYSTSADSLWAGPIVLGSLVNPDDIAAIVEFGGKVGVLWSNQQDWAFYFRYHNPLDPPIVWAPQETVLEGVQVADDHISLAADASGRVFGALKDQYDRIIVVRRNLDATWNANMDIQYGNIGTRPVILVDDNEAKIYVFYTRWPTGSHIGTNWIEYRVANYNTMVFGVETVFIGGDGTTVSMNNVQSTKQRLSSGSLLAICDASDGKAYWNGWGPISGIGGTGGGGQLPMPPSAPAAPTASRATAPGGTLGVAAYTLEEGSGPTSADASGRGHTLLLGTTAGVDGTEPDWTSGLTGAALAFNGINDVCTIADAADLHLAGSFTVECWLKLLSQPDRMGLLNKGGSTDRNFRLMVERNGDINFSYKDAANVEHLLNAPASVVDMEWHHIAGVRDATLKQLRLYVDGQVKATLADSWTPVTSTAPVNVGARQTTLLKDYLHGLLDQIRISPTAVYNANFSPPVAFTTSPTNYIKLVWTAPPAQGGISGYNVFRSTNAAAFEQLNALLVTTPQYTDASARDGYLKYSIVAVDMIGQQSPQSPPTSIEFEQYDPLPPTEPRAYAVSRHVSAGGLVAAYPLDEGTGQNVLDAAGNMYNGVLGATSSGEAADPTRTTGISNGALEFDGSADYVTIPDATGLRLPGSMTLEAWFKLNQTGKLGTILGKGGSSQRNYRVTVTTSGAIEFTWDTSSGASHKLTSTRTITDLLWHHVSCVYDAEGRQMRIYLDGILAGSKADSGTPITGSDPLYFGARRSSSSLKDWFKGRIDLVQIFSAPVRSDNFTPPTSLGSTTGGGYVTLRWDLPQYGLVYGYNVYRSINGQIVWLQNRGGMWTETTYTDERPHPGDNCYFVRAVNAHGMEGVATQVTCASFTSQEAPTDAAGAPMRRGLGLRVAPNPFNPTTRLSFHMERAGTVQLWLYDVAGHRVRTWTWRELAAGEHQMPLQLEQHGSRLGSGIYFLRLRAGGAEARERLVIVK